MKTNMVKALYIGNRGITSLEGIPIGGLIWNIPTEKPLIDELWEEYCNYIEDKCIDQCCVREIYGYAVSSQIIPLGRLYELSNSYDYCIGSANKFIDSDFKSSNGGL